MDYYQERMARTNYGPVVMMLVVFLLALAVVFGWLSPPVQGGLSEAEVMDAHQGQGVAAEEGNRL